MESVGCAWPRREVEGLRARLEAQRAHWPAIAKASCLGLRYLRAFARGQIYCPPYDRFVLIQAALAELAKARLRETSGGK
jgi:hypothetical protein